LAEYAVHSLSPCCGLLTALLLLNSVARWWNTANLFPKWCNFTCLCAWASEGFIQGGTSGFFWKFLQGRLKVVKFVFYHSKRRKRLFANSCPLFRRPCVCVWKVRATPLKNWCNFKRINIILNSAILLNLIRKIKCLTDQIQFFDQIQLRRTRACFVYLCHNPRSSLH